MAVNDIDSEYESGAPGPSIKKLVTETVHKKCVKRYTKQDLKPSVIQSTDNELQRLNKEPKTSAERGREFRARRALLRKQKKQEEEQNAIDEISAGDIPIVGPSGQLIGPSEMKILLKRARSAEATRRWREKKRGVSEKKKPKTAAQRMREYRLRQKFLKLMQKQSNEDYKNAYSEWLDEQNIKSIEQKPTKTHAQRQREYRQRRKIKINEIKKIKGLQEKEMDGLNSSQLNISRTYKNITLKKKQEDEISIKHEEDVDDYNIREDNTEVSTEEVNQRLLTMKCEVFDEPLPVSTSSYEPTSDVSQVQVKLEPQDADSTEGALVFEVPPVKLEPVDSCITLDTEQIQVKVEREELEWETVGTDP